MLVECMVVTQTKERKICGVKDAKGISRVPWVVRPKKIKWEIRSLVPSLWHLRRSLQYCDTEVKKKKKNVRSPA